jgi:hypothetical protein
MNSAFLHGSDSRQKPSHANQGVIMIVGERCHGDAGNGCCNACKMLWMPFIMRLLDDECNMGTVVGSQINVLQTRVARDAQIQTV